MLRYISTILLLVAGIALHPEQAFAVQAHGGAEGLVSHQLGHLLFIGGISFLLYKTYQEHLPGKGWVYFKSFLWLIIAWNILTFTGHQLHELPTFQKMELTGPDGLATGYQMNDLRCLIYYLTRLDHLILVPAFCCLLSALGKWERDL